MGSQILTVMEIVIPLKKAWKTFLSITDEPLVFNANANRCPANLWLAKFYNGTFVLPLHESLWPDNWRLCRKNRNSNCQMTMAFKMTRATPILKILNRMLRNMMYSIFSLQSVM